jgi:hypothetical protein
MAGEPAAEFCRLGRLGCIRSRSPGTCSATWSSGNDEREIRGQEAVRLVATVLKYGSRLTRNQGAKNRERSQ